MKINNIDSDSINLNLIDREIIEAEIINNSEWLDNSLEPITENLIFKYKLIKLEFLIEENTEDLAIKKISKLTEMLSDAVLKFDDLSMSFKGQLDSIESDKITIGKYSVYIDFKSGFGYDSEITKTITNTGSITLDSTMDTPVILEVTANKNIPALTITGLGEDIVLYNVKNNIPIIIDGNSKIVNENYESWGFPKLKTGVNNIVTSDTLTSSAVDDITPTYKKYKAEWYYDDVHILSLEYTTSTDSRDLYKVSKYDKTCIMTPVTTANVKKGNIYLSSGDSTKWNSTGLTQPFICLNDGSNLYQKKYYADSEKSRLSLKKGDYIEDVTGTGYPENGVHTDEFYYELQGEIADISLIIKYNPNWL